MLRLAFLHSESDKSLDLLEKIISIALGGFGALRRYIAFFISVIYPLLCKYSRISFFAFHGSVLSMNFHRPNPPWLLMAS
jgi:hypothetical protein